MRVILRSSIPTLGCVPCVPATPPPSCGTWGSVVLSTHLLGHQTTDLDGGRRGHRGALHLPGPGTGFEHAAGFTEVGRGGWVAIDLAGPTEAPAPPQGRAICVKGEPRRPGSRLVPPPPFLIPAPSSPGNPSLGWHPWDTAQQVAAQAGRTGRRWSLASPVHAERGEDAGLQALNLRTQSLHTLWVRLWCQCGSCWGNFGQGAVLGREGGRGRAVRRLGPGPDQGTAWGDRHAR